jgi:hypothetical protein
MPEMKGDERYFAALREVFAQDSRFAEVRCNPATASLLLTGEGASSEAAVALGESKELFRLERSVTQPVPLSRKIIKPIGDLSAFIQRASGGEVDLAGMTFVALLVTGAYQIARGRFAAPPWYTAFWYALGVFTKTIVDKNTKRV